MDHLLAVSAHQNGTEAKGDKEVGAEVNEPVLGTQLTWDRPSLIQMMPGDRLWFIQSPERAFRRDNIDTFLWHRQKGEDVELQSIQRRQLFIRLEWAIKTDSFDP